MALCALVKNLVVVDIQELKEEDMIEYVKEYDSIIGIDELTVRPEIGWVFDFNKLNPPPEIIVEDIPEYRLELKCRTARKFGESLSKIAADKIGGRNLTLGKTEAQIQTFAGQLIQLKLILDGGALVTAKSIMVLMKSAYPEYADLFQWAIDEVDTYRSKI